MALISKNVRSAIVPHIKAKFSLLCCNSNPDEFGSRFGSSSCSSSDGKDDKPSQHLLNPSSGGSNNPSAPTMYDSRKYGHKLSTNTVCPNFETLQNIPTGVFRDTTGEVLGRNVGKCCYYQNPEYFSFHHMSFYDFNIGLRQYRKACPKSGRKPV